MVAQDLTRHWAVGPANMKAGFRAFHFGFRNMSNDPPCINNALGAGGLPNALSALMAECITDPPLSAIQQKNVPPPSAICFQLKKTSPTMPAGALFVEPKV